MHKPCSILLWFSYKTITRHNLFLLYCDKQAKSDILFLKSFTSDGPIFTLKQNNNPNFTI